MPPRDADAEASVIALARSALDLGQQALATNDHATARRWLERAHRLVPLDPNATLILASLLLADDPARAAILFADITERHVVVQAWAGLAAARLRLSDPDGSAAALAHALSCYAVTNETAALAERIVAQGAFPGWCGIADGRLQVSADRPGSAGRPGRIRLRLDGQVLRGQSLPASWSSGRALDVLADYRPLLGSPIRLDRIRALSGCVEARQGGIGGWVWHPADPEILPVLTLSDATGRVLKRWAAGGDASEVADVGPLARPRAINVPSSWLRRAVAPFHLRGPDGKDLLGSPLDPGADEQAHVVAARSLRALYPADPAQAADPPSMARAAAAVLRADAPRPASPIGVGRRRRVVTVVIPVHEALAVVQPCLDSVLATLPDWARVLVVDDGSRDPALVDLLDRLASQRAIGLLRHDSARGFPASANAGLRAARGRDVVLLNSDTLLPANWLQRLHDAAYASRDIGTVTPLSNDATILSYPAAAGTNPKPDRPQVAQLDRIARQANRQAVVDIPVGVGFCLYIRRDCLDAVGLLRADLFAQGYGEETDFCLRSHALGWRSVALTGLFVGHLSGQSFGSAATHLQARNTRVIEQLHPGYAALIARFIAADPLAPARRRMDAVAWRQRARAWRGAAVLVTHDDGGGVEQRMQASARSHAEAGRWPIILRPALTASGDPAITVRDGSRDDLPNLVFALPGEVPTLLALLRSARPELLEVHHLLGFDPAVHGLLRRLDLPCDVHVHDYAWFCPRVVLVTGGGRYCGEPDVATCEACIADHGHFLSEDISAAALWEQSAAFLHAARRIIVPSDDTGTRMKRHFPGLTTLTAPHMPALADRPGRSPAQTTAPRSRTVCVAGALGVHKGYDVLLACARDAARRDLDLDFAVVGHTIDDAGLLNTGRVFITGRFSPDEAVELIIEQKPRLGFVPSICPETWCLSLDDLWRAGLNVAAFDIGAPAERIRRTGHGFLLPLGLSANAINNALIAAMQAATPQGHSLFVTG